MAGVLCEVCAAISSFRPCQGPEYRQLGKSYSTHVFYPHHRSVEELKLSSDQKGCRFCSILLFAITNDNEDKPLGDDDWEFLVAESDSKESAVPSSVIQAHAELFSPESLSSVQHDDPASPVVIEVVLRDPAPDESEDRCTEVFVHWTSTDHESGCSKRQKAGGLCIVLNFKDDLAKVNETRLTLGDQSTGSAPTLELAKFWLQSCDKSHEFCHQDRASKPRYLPTRVLDVADEKHIFLHVPNSMQQGKYVSLSHCWGTGKQFKLETANIQSRQSSIAPEEMPKTFRDAIYITRYMGLRYLWIDSLCIIQDSEQDWQQEAAKMGQYYRDASFTIIASAADGDEKGCFWNRDSRTVIPFRAPMFDGLFKTTNTTNTAFVQKVSRHWLFDTRVIGDHVLHNVVRLNFRTGMPLDERGWTLQEYLMSSRVLIFDTLEVVWACKTTSACECVPEGSRGPTTDERQTIRRSIGDLWNEMVEIYSERRFSFPKDKLPALAGVAAELLEQMPGNYLAGLWQDGLRQQLAWFVTPLEGSPTSRTQVDRSKYTQRSYTRRSVEYRAPSWSWASVDGHMKTRYNAQAIKEGKTLSGLRRRAFEAVCVIKECQTVPRTSLNPLGEVISGILRLRGHVECVEIGTPFPARDLIWMTPILDPKTGDRLGRFFSDDTSSPLPTSTKIWCILLDSDKVVKATCLALVPATEIEQARAKQHYDIPERIFQRVGIIQDLGRLPVQGESIASNFQVTNTENAVTYEPNLELSSLRSLLDFLGAFEVSDICVV